MKITSIMLKLLQLSRAQERPKSPQTDSCVRSIAVKIDKRGKNTNDYCIIQHPLSTELANIVRQEKEVRISIVNCDIKNKLETYSTLRRNNYSEYRRQRINITISKAPYRSIIDDQKKKKTKTPKKPTSRKGSGNKKPIHTRDAFDGWWI